MKWPSMLAAVFAGLIALLAFSCGGGNSSSNSSSQDACNCTAVAPASEDYRHDEKHIALPGGTPKEIDVATILSWPVPVTPAFDAPRTGKELQLFHIAHAFAREVRLVGADCDLHIEVSDTTDPSAPRVIIETPIESEYCPVRRAVQSALRNRHLDLGDNIPGELAVPIPVEITGLAFLDEPHTRGSVFVATTWELHPATVNVLSQ